MSNRTSYMFAFLWFMGAVLVLGGIILMEV